MRHTDFRPIPQRWLGGTSRGDTRNIPGSLQNFDAAVAHLIRTLSPRSCLDIGCGEGLKVVSASQGEFFDLAIIGDCIEHMPKSVGLDLLNFLTYRTQHTIVLAPEFSVQGSVNGVVSKSHVSVWSEVDFDRLIDDLNAAQASASQG